MTHKSFDPRQATIALETEHGSRLYGLAHANSDQDTYTVFTDAPDNLRLQSLKGQDDQFWISLDSFLRMCDDGIPQALEAMFSPTAQRNTLMEAYCHSYRASLTQMRMRYRRAIDNFAQGETFKSKRHAFRLALNLEQAERNGGRFCPKMTAHQRQYLDSMATLDGTDFTDALESALTGHLFA